VIEEMNTDHADAIESLMAQGYSRVRAIKIFYEQSLAKYYSKQYQSEGASVGQVSSSSIFLCSHLLSLSVDWFGKEQC
jgi:hypothetical protein